MRALEIIQGRGIRRFFLTVPLLIFIVIAGYDITSPGLYYDEVLFVNAALGGKINMFVHSRLGEVPFMLMPYLGALKAWLYYPIFKFFDVTVFSIRWPVIMIGALTLWINYEFVKKAFSRSAAIIFLMMACVEPSTIFHTRLDWGPTALMMFFRGLMLLSLLYWLHTGKVWMLLASVAAAVLGIFDKHNFTWLVLATLIACVLIYRDNLKVYIRNYRNVIIIIGASVFGLMLIIYGQQLFNFMSREVVVKEWAIRVQYVYHLLRGTISGTSIYGWIIGDAGRMASVQLWILAVASVVSLSILTFTFKEFQHRQPLLFVVSLLVLTLVLLFLTRQATGPHHAAVLAPLWLVPIAVGLSVVFEQKRPPRLFLKGIVVAIVTCVFVSSLMINFTYLKGFRSSVSSTNWSHDSYELSGWLNEKKGHSIVCVDWGLGTVLYALSNGESDIHDMWPSFTKPLSDADAEYFDKYFSRKALFVVPADGKENFSDTRKHFFNAAKHYGWRLQKVDEIKGMQGLSLIEVYKIGSK